MEDFGRAERRVKGILNRDLQEICKREQLPISGIKSQLQKRVLDRLRYYMNSGSTILYNELHSRICGPPASQTDPTSTPSLPSPSYANYNSSTAYASNSSPAYHPHQTSGPFSFGSPSYMAPRNNSSAHQRLQFKDDPFHRIREAKSAQIDMPGTPPNILKSTGDGTDDEKVMISNRNTVSVRLNLSEPLASQIAADKKSGKHRIMIYCGNDFRSPAPHIAFPQQCEIKVNGELFQGNLRGLKKKIGTTHPADITSLLRTRPANYTNEITLTYAATDKKKYAFILNYVEKVSAEDLVLKIGGRHLSKNSVLQEMKREANDPDIVATSRVMSLSCPIGGGRIKTPARTSQCTHNQCFDAYNFFLAQMQAPQWECPVCYKPAQLNALVIDEYFDDILLRTSQTQAINVTVHPDGAWEDKTPVKKEPERPKKKVEAISLDDSEDEGGRSFSASIKPEPLPTPTGIISNSPFGSSATPSASSKRPAAQVIDLTLSDDDDAAPPPKHPRFNFSLSRNSSLPSLHKQNDHRSQSSSGERGYSMGGLPTRPPSSAYETDSHTQQGQPLQPVRSSFNADARRQSSGGASWGSGLGWDQHDYGGYSSYQ